MTPESWRRVGEIFHQAVEVPTADRGRWVVSACNENEELLREVNSLLRNDQDARAFVQERLKAGVEAFVDDERVRRTPERAGPYRLIREIGHGGMGTVYLAERDDDQYKIAAAIKLVTPGLDTDFVLRRFRRERQILAQLDHPNIARLLDGGTTAEGLPYIVMEYVAGQPISEYCRQRHLTTGEILKLFLNVCAAVAHAHRQFIVHRDLKPGNILVRPDGAVKLLDFGICKVLYSHALLGGDTVTDGGRLLTPDYASPEQIRGDPVTIASDVYSLAAVLYELLTGQKPHRFKNASLLEVERAVCEQEITRPSAAVPDAAIARRLRGDLDLILLQALDKDPARRYTSVEQFADDLRRHLERLPVKAQEPRLSYRLRKLIARRKASFATAALVVAMLA
ncbi:MAG TPA: serine/threonine-protein kinase, partial [Candidatus Binatia bacterium]|nr:serine/threonine-protein kinase [Candidatus Binatia bacterium]